MTARELSAALILWREGWTSFEIAEVLGRAEAEVARVLRAARDIRREQEALERFHDR